MDPQLSGVGIRGLEHDQAPTDSAFRYDDPDLDPSAVMKIWLLRSNFGPPTALDYDATWDFEDTWGFPFHESCWTLLNALHRSEEADIRLLNNLCRSFPNKGED
jgi:hypothetical protein